MKVLFAALWPAALIACADLGAAQEPVRYVVRVDEPTSRLYHVEASLSTAGDTTYVSLPSWTPGHYELEEYARYVRLFDVTGQGGAPLRWDKADKDTWRIVTTGHSQMRISFDYLADRIGLSESLLEDDFGFFNGTNLFVYPETGYDFAAEVRFELPDGWRVATELEETEDPFLYRAADYHELVDNPTFLGHFAIDSVEVDGVWTRLALYPATYMRDPGRQLALDALQKIADTAHDLFGEPPYDRYTTFVYLSTQPIAYVGGLEHANSHLDIMSAVMFERPSFAFRQYLYPLLAHEYYHAWNVKRIRPAELWPYDYGREQFTPLLWLSEGVTDYYADLILVRGGLWDEGAFWASLRSEIAKVEDEPAHEAVEDASINTWINPTFIDDDYYYPKGKLIGLLLDVLIRDASENRNSLDDLMARLYRERYQRDRGVTTEDVLVFLSEYIGDEASQRFYRDYVDGRQPLPFAEILARAGLSYEADTIVDPFFGIDAIPGRNRSVIVRNVEPGTEASRIGLRPGDALIRVGSVDITSLNWGQQFREAYADSIGAEITVVYRRGEDERSVQAAVRTRTRYGHSLEPSPEAGARAAVIRRGIVQGERGGLLSEETGAAN